MLLLLTVVQQFRSEKFVKLITPTLQQSRQFRWIFPLKIPIARNARAPN